jgi:hypothetical protein
VEGDCENPRIYPGVLNKGSYSQAMENIRLDPKVVLGVKMEQTLVVVRHNILARAEGAKKEVDLMS